MAGPTAVPYMNSRRRPPPTGDEEASYRLKLGEMEESQSLSVAEANVLLHYIDEQRKRDGTMANNKDVFVKARDYVSLFARFKDHKTVEQIERETRLTQGIHHFERAQLGMTDEDICGRLLTGMIATLCCDTAEEARTLIPSLENKISDDDLQALLDNISKLRDFS
ncbi:hypothetical protein AMS68_002476 [Peltaster fructicola]|uniref:RNA polymerase Rpb4/RPC9 core domain-containing protein n=1 Tax=Peltaster fructicola TaxID=286661 RepID=A0A6H0XQR3_9PEZI|nr:hypothetical protein AMS68_002476 [Peltaster fructicola]